MSPEVELVRLEPGEPLAAEGAALLEPFDEQTAFDVRSGARALFAVRITPDGALAGSAVLGQGALDLHIHQELRARGLGKAAAAQLLQRAGSAPLTAWSHDDHPAAAALAADFGFTRSRALLQLRRDGLDGFEASQRFDSFRPGVDDEPWVALNARVFAWHPEQGGITRADLTERMAEPWFDAADFLIARDSSGDIVGYNWLKAEPPLGEIYVIGVAPESAGHGLGRSLMTAGLARLHERGCTAAELYVEADNAAAVGLYRALGFSEAAVHVQYARPAAE